MSGICQNPFFRKKATARSGGKIRPQGSNSAVLEPAEKAAPPAFSPCGSEKRKDFPNPIGKSPFLDSGAGSLP